MAPITPAAGPPDNATLAKMIADLRQEIADLKQANRHLRREIMGKEIDIEPGEGRRARVKRLHEKRNDGQGVDKP